MAESREQNVRVTLRLRIRPPLPDQLGQLGEVCLGHEESLVLLALAGEDIGLDLGQTQPLPQSAYMRLMARMFYRLPAAH